MVERTGEGRRKRVKKKMRKLPLKREELSEEKTVNVSFVKCSHQFDMVTLLAALRVCHGDIPGKAKLRFYRDDEDDNEYPANPEEEPDGVEVYWREDEEIAK